MYDNIDFILDRDKSPGADFLAVVPQYLKGEINEGCNSFGQYVTGGLGSLKLSVTDTRVKIFNSSLCKYYLGDNFKTLTRSDTARAIEQISDSLHLPFDRARVTRIDAAHNLIMQHPEQAYYPLLGQAPYYTRLEQNNGLYYTNGKRQLVFYGKEHEQKIKGQPTPELYRGRHIIRYEIRWLQRLLTQFNRPELTAALLSDEDFYREIVKRWHDQYFTINKINSKLCTMKPTGKATEFVANLALLTILELGQPNILTLVKTWQKSGEITKKQAHDLRGKVKKISRAQADAPGGDLIAELDRKVKEAGQYN